jgi:multicomponent Na+:H+ antiporter subunit D
MINVKLCWLAAIGSTAASFAMAFTLLMRVYNEGVISYHLGNWAPPIGIEYRMDMMNAFVLTVLTFISLISLVYARTSINNEIASHKQPVFYALYMLFTVGLFGMTATGDLFNIYVFLEITSLSGYALIAAGKKRYSLASSFNYLIIGTIGATFIVIGIGYIYVMTGTLNIVDAAIRLKELQGTTAVLAAYSFMLAGLLIKMAVFPLHFWLPDS